MILEGDFYTLTNTVVEQDRIQALIAINARHEIFKGHFPGQPVVPGVCMMQMVKEMVETSTGFSLRLQQGHDLKFLAVIDPEKNNRVNAEASYTRTEDTLQVTARLFNNEITFFKFKGSFVRTGIQVAK